MPTSVTKPSQQNWTRAYAVGGTRVAIGVLIVVGLVWLVIGTIYLSSTVGLDLQPAPVIDLGGSGVEFLGVEVLPAGRERPLPSR